MTHVLVVVPVFDDWPSLGRLLADLDALPPGDGVQLSVLAVNDGSLSPLPARDMPAISRLRRVEVLELACNLGHQRAIALGLAHAARMADVDVVAVMDGDGEDRPEDLARLLSAYHAVTASTVVVARRCKRSESMLFRIAYRGYKALFRLLTGRSIAFGNFSLFSHAVAVRLAHSADVWNHLAAAILRSRLPLLAVPVERGKRYEGRSKLDLVSLLVHGLSAISVFADRLFARLAVACLGLCGLAFLGAITVIVIRTSTDWAIPGWASSVAGLLLVVFMQAVMLPLIAAFLLLSNRAQATVIPAAMLESLVFRVIRLASADVDA